MSSHYFSEPNYNVKTARRPLHNVAISKYFPITGNTQSWHSLVLSKEWQLKLRERHSVKYLSLPHVLYEGLNK